MSPKTGNSFLAELAHYQRLIEEDLATTSEDMHAQAWEFGQNGLQAVELFTDNLLRPAKRLRAALVVVAYQMCGGKKPDVVLSVARAFEMMQSYLLVVDDVFDQSDTRRGGDAAHVAAAKLHTAAGLNGDSNRFGESLAICAGLIGDHAALQTILEADMPANVKVRVISAVNKAITITLYGQVNDLFNEANGNVTTEQVKNTLIWKTAYYTFVGPLMAGALAAGINDADEQVLRDYGVHMGLAFQAMDDWLGTFGDPNVSGKSNYDDLRDGKVTLLVRHVFDHGTRQQQVELQAFLDRANPTDAMIQSARDVMRAAGADVAVRVFARQQAELALKALQKAPVQWTQEHVAFLRDLAEYVVNRRG